MSRRGRRSSAKPKNHKGRRKADKSLKFKMNVGKNRTSDVVLCNNVVSDGAEQCAEEMPRKWRNTSAKQKNRNNRSRAEKIMKKKTLRRIRRNGKNCTIVSAINANSDDAAQNATAVNTNKNNACNHYDIPEDTIRSWYDRIFHKLNEDTTKRVYHNWSCMLAPKRIELEKAKPQIVLATFFQYYEFDLEKSCIQENCEIFKEFCQDAMIEDNDMKQLVCRLLGEKTTESMNADIDDDLAILQDLDLLILASSPDVYKNYAELSRQEWSTSGKTNFDTLRRKTLTTLLALDIYQTTEFCNKYAKAARANIEQELKELEKS